MIKSIWTPEEDKAVETIIQNYRRNEGKLKGNIDYQKAQNGPEWQQVMAAGTHNFKTIQQRVSYLRQKLGLQVFKRPYKVRRINNSPIRHQGENLVKPKTVLPNEINNDLCYCPRCALFLKPIQIAMSIKKAN